MRLHVLPPVESSIPAGIENCTRERGSDLAVKRLNKALMAERVYPGKPKEADGIDRLLAAINGGDPLERKAA